MARLQDRHHAILLRKEGKSYSQIKEVISVSKGTLSSWLKNLPLSEGRLRELRDWNQQRIERFRETMRSKRERRLRAVYEEQKVKLLPLTQKELLIAGLFLHLGEGLKATSSEVSLANTNPFVISFFVYFLKEICSVSTKRLRVRLHLYEDMDIAQEIQYWIHITGLPGEQFRRPYIKKSSLARVNYRGGFGHGTCNIIGNDVRLFEEIKMSTQVILDAICGHVAQRQ